MVPRTADDIDAPWLESVFGDAGVGGWLDDIAVAPIATGVGLLGAAVRVSLRWAAPAPAGAPASVVVKLPSADARTRAIAEQFGYYRREAGVYRDLLPREGIRTPRALAVLDGPIGPVLVLEDLADARAADQVEGATREQALTAAELLAGIHATFWDDATLHDHPWLPFPTDEVVAGYGRLFELTWPVFVNTMGARVPADHLSAAERAITRFDEVVATFAQGPHTLVHGDFRLDNLLFAPPDPEMAALGADEPVPWVLDWQLAAGGRGPYDLAFFLAGSMTPNQRRLHERAIVERYHGYLQLGGVGDYSLDDCWRDYRLGHVLNLPNPITALVAVPPGNERGAELLARNAERALAALADLDRRGHLG
jgi:hypothetical protein